MADFLPCFERMIVNEGGYVLTNHPGDNGGQTYAGIARNRWPRWVGWRAIDAGGRPGAHQVRDFYRENFWEPVHLGELASQDIARMIFDFGVNAGTGVAVKLAQVAVGQTPDGVAGTKTLEALNAADPAGFVARYSLAKLARYRDIARRDPSQRKWLFGWLTRTLQEAAA